MTKEELDALEDDVDEDDERMFEEYRYKQSPLISLEILLIQPVTQTNPISNSLAQRVLSILLHLIKSSLLSKHSYGSIQIQRYSASVIRFHWRVMIVVFRVGKISFLVSNIPIPIHVCRSYKYLILSEKGTKYARLTK